MNNDRFLTRIWDKQKKKMIYKHQEFVYDGFEYIYESVTNNAIIASEYNHIIVIELEDRFVPMMCTGLKDKNGKLIYEGDVISSCNILYNIHEDEDFIYIASGINCDFKLFVDKNLKGTELIGNIHENPELMEVKA